MSKLILWRTPSFAAIVVAVLLVASLRAQAQTTVGGHIGFSVPWVTHEGGDTTSVFDSYSFGMPFGITIKGQGPLFVDFEFVPAISQTPHQTTLTVDPGILYSLPKGFTVGLRAAFDVDSSRIGFIPLVNKGWKLHDQTGFFKKVFVEIDVPINFSRPTGGPATNPVTFATQFGLAF